MKIAAQLFTVRKFMDSDEDVLKTFEKIRKIGYEAVQISGISAYHPRNIVKALKENGLQACVTHNSFDRIVGDTDALIEENKLFGTKYIGIGCFSGKSLNDYKKFLDDISPALEKIHAAGLGFTYHNHDHEFKIYDGVRPIDYLREHTDKERFSFLPDMYWIQRAGGSPIKFLKDFQGRTPIVHFKDMRVPPEEGKTSMAEIFEGNMDYESIYAECIARKVEWAAIEQDECDGDPFESLAISLKNLKERKMC